MEKKHIPYGPYEKYFKRPIDIFCGLAAVIVFSWLYLILIILGAIFMRGNPFFTQERPGKDEKIFKLIKFRSMDNRKDRDGNLLPDAVRLNKYGRFLRATSLDELPEAFNIIKETCPSSAPGRCWLVIFPDTTQSSADGTKFALVCLAMHRFTAEMRLAGRISSGWTWNMWIILPSEGI